MNNSRSTGTEAADARAGTARVANLRARALAALHRDGMTYAEIANATGLSKVQVQRLVTKGKASSIIRDGRPEPK